MLTRLFSQRAVFGFSAVLLIALTAVGAFRATAVRAEEATKESERWLHVRVEKGGDDAAMVRVNVPLKMAERVLAAMLPEGKLKLDKEPELFAVLASVRYMEDNEYVTVDSVHGSIRVAKEHGYLVVEGMEIGKRGKILDIKIPFHVLEVMISEKGDEVDVLAGLRALGKNDDLLVKAYDATTLVSVWIDNEKKS